MSFCDELRKIEWENSYSNKKEEIIHREVEGLITGIKVLSRNAARDGKRNLTGYYDQFYWDTTDYFIQPSVSETGFQRYTMLSFLKGYSQYEAMNIRQEIVKRLRRRLAEMGYRNVQLRIDEVAQKEDKKYFAKKTGVTLYYLWLNISW